MAVFLTNYRIKYGIDEKDESFCCFILATNFSIMSKDFLYTAEYQ